jgi:hypothetical protein
LKTIDPVALAKFSEAKRQAKAVKDARAVYQRIREYGEVSNKEAARRLTAEGFPKIFGKGPWTGTDIRRCYVRIIPIYGLDLDAADLRRLNEETDHYENTRRSAQGKRALSYEKWRFVEASPRPPLRFTNPVDSQDAKGKLDHLRKAKQLLGEKTSVMAIPPLSLETIEDKEQRQLWNERLGLTLGRRKYHWGRLTQPFADSAIGNAIIEAFAPKLGEALVHEIDAALVDEAACIAIRQVLVELGKGFDRKHSLSRVTSDIIKALGDAATLQRMKQQYPDQYRRLERALQASASARKKQ